MIASNLWNELMLKTLEHLSSIEFQERVWRRGDGPEVSSFEEVYSEFFDILMSDGEFNGHWRNLNITAYQWEALKSFAAILEEFGNSVPEIPHPNDILDNPQWVKIRSAAHTALEIMYQH
jgi:hypothetical protein